MSKSNNSVTPSITPDQYDAVCLPLGKALSVLDLFVADLPRDQANGGYVAQDLIREAQTILDRIEGGGSAENQASPSDSKNGGTKKKAEMPATSLDDDVHLRFGPDATASKIVDFISKRLAQLNASLMTFQSDLHLESEGGSNMSVGGRLSAVWGLLDYVQQVKTGFREYNRVAGQETAS